MSSPRLSRNPWLYFFGTLLVFGVLLLPVVGRQGISWDEQYDLWVAQSYLVKPGGWLSGSDIDPSQTRLPMATVGLVYQALGISDLITARLVSCFVGGLTLLAIFIYCKRQFTPAVGVLACLLLATSPFFLSFARVAFTETDIYLACTLAWLMVCLSWMQDRPSLGRASWVGIVLGLALSAKFTTLAIFPVAWYAIFQSKPASANDLPQSKVGMQIFWVAWNFAWLGIGLSVRSDDLPVNEMRSFYFSLLVAWLIPLIWAGWRHRSRFSRLGVVFWITGLALLTFLVLPPEHLTNPEILRSLRWRFDHEMEFKLSFLKEAAGLHLGSLIFKSGPLIGFGMLVSYFLALFQWQKKPALRFPFLLVLFYFIGLIRLPLAQTFYIVPLLPVLAVFASDQFLRLFASRRRLAVGLALLAVILWGVDISRCYPDYNLNGYQWLGKRVIFGRSSVGYRSIVQTPSDGVEQAIRYLNEHASPGDRVHSYLLEWHIVQAAAPSPAYRIEDGFSARSPNEEYLGVAIYPWFLENTPFAPPRPNPDYVVVEINTQVRQSWWMDISGSEIFKPPYNVQWLEANYARVFTVRRAFGIEMTSVWKKR